MVPSSETPQPWASLSKQQRVALVYRIRVWYPRMKSIYDEIVRAYEMNPVTPDPECVALLGGFRNGKTTIIESFYELHPRVILEETTFVPILKAEVPGKASLPNMLTTMLAALGDPCADRGSTGAKEYRLHNLLKDCQVRMIILDDANHFVDRDSERVLHDVSNTMKSLIKVENVACILVGLPYTEEVLRVNEQFGSLFGDPQLLEPFQWDENKPETIQQLSAWLNR